MPPCGKEKVSWGGFYICTLLIGGKSMTGMVLQGQNFNAGIISQTIFKCRFVA